MSKMTPEEKEAFRKAVSDRVVQDASKDWSGEHFKHWRAWGSWFSWGSPVGLGLFFIETAAAIWIIAQVF
jgi:hypothetical protein